jgi:hypothetical protein
MLVVILHKRRLLRGNVRISPPLEKGGEGGFKRKDATLRQES